MNKLLIVLLAIVFQLQVSGQDRKWNVEKSKDGKVLVKSEIVTREDKNGDEYKTIYYIAETQRKIGLDKLEKFLRNSENHKLFWENTEVSKEVRSISDNEWITYLYFDAPWPMPNSDCVQRLKITKNDKEGLIIKGDATPTAYEKKEVGRMTTYDVVFDFKKLDNGEVKFTLTTSFVPVGDVPKFLLNTWFPEGPAGIVTRLLDGAAK